MAYQSITQFDSPFFAPGNGRRPTSITIHWWDRPERRPTFDGTVAWLCRPDTTASIHYVAEAGRVACLVDPENIAWHAGDGGRGAGNLSSIGIEMNPRQSAGDYATVAELVADLRKVYGNLPLVPHRNWTNTECPGTVDLARIDREARGAAAPAAPAPAPAPAPRAQTVTLPASAQRWGIYPQGVAPVVANIFHYLTPAAFGGLTYEIKGWTVPGQVALIDTGVRGRVQIYVAPGTGAVIR